MTSSDFIGLANASYEKALAGKRLLLTGDSFFVSVLEKHLINKLADANVHDVSLATYKPALNAHFFSGGQILVIDFFNGARGLHQLQFVDDLDEIVVLESTPGSAKVLVDDHIVPVTVMFDRVSFVTMED